MSDMSAPPIRRCVGAARNWCKDVYCSRCAPSRDYRTLRADPWLRFTVPALVLARIICALLLIGVCHPWRLGSLTVANELTLSRNDHGITTELQGYGPGNESLPDRLSYPFAYTYIPAPACDHPELNAALVNACIPSLSSLNGGCTTEPSGWGGATSWYLMGWLVGVVIILLFPCFCVCDNHDRACPAKESGEAFCWLVVPLLALNALMFFWGRPHLNVAAEVSTFCVPFETPAPAVPTFKYPPLPRKLNLVEGRCTINDAAALDPAVGWFNRSRYSEADVDSCRGARVDHVKGLLMIDLQPSPRVFQAVQAHLGRWRRDTVSLVMLAIALIFAVPFPSKSCCCCCYSYGRCHCCSFTCCYCCPGATQAERGAVTAPVKGDGYVDHDDADDDGPWNHPHDDSAVHALLDRIGQREYAHHTAWATTEALARRNNRPTAAMRARERLDQERLRVRDANEAVCSCCVGLGLTLSHTGLPREVQSLVAGYCVVHQHDMAVRLADPKV